MSAATRARAGSGADRTTQLIEEAADAFTDEVVTRALVRDVQLPGGAGTLALITLDNGFDHSRPTTFGPRGLLDLDAALDRLAGRAVAGEIVAVGLTGKPFVFAVGADLGMMSSGLARGPDREAALAVGRMGHRAFRRLGELGVPSFAYVNGAALGGGLEIALHCTYRTMSTGATAIGLPECFLGLLPGWGGCHLLPNLIGPAGALEVIITNPLNQNRMIDARWAMALGIADALFEPADFLEESLAWTGRVLAGKTGVGRAEIDRSAEAWEAAIGPVTTMVDLKLHGAAPAPYRAIELVRLARTADATTAFAAEDEAAADLATGEELRAGLYAFDLVNKRAKRPAGAPSPALARPVGMVGIVGAGLMAGQLALLFARRLQVPVVMTDLDQARVDRGVGYVHGEIDTLLARGRIGADAANRLKGLVTGTTDRTAFAGADLVLEAVFEQMATKRQVLAEMEEVVGPECVLMTNTSSLSVTAMAAGLAHPERVGRLPLLQPGRRAPAGRGRAGRADRRPDARHRVRRRQTAAQVLRARPGRAGVRRQPAADPVPRRDHRRGRRRDAAAGRRPCAGPDRAADEPVHAAGAGRPRRGTARRGDDARGVPRPVRRLGEPETARRGGQDLRVVLRRGGQALPARRRGRADRAGRRGAHRTAGRRPRAGGARPGDPDHAGRRGSARGPGRRPVPAARGRVAVPPRRDHAVPGPGGDLGTRDGPAVRRRRVDPGSSDSPARATGRSSPGPGGTLPVSVNKWGRVSGGWRFGASRSRSRFWTPSTSSPATTAWCCPA
jgi:enoyl-CoA hydratase/carnithine racemase